MSYTNENVIALVAKAIKMRKGEIEGDITSKDADYKAVSSDFETARASALSTFDTAYSAKEQAKDDDEAAALQAALNAVQAARDAIVVDDGDPSVVDTLAEMETQINNELTAFNTQQGLNEQSLATDRTAIETAFGVNADYSDTADRSYTVVSAIA